LFGIAQDWDSLINPDIDIMPDDIMSLNKLRESCREIKILAITADSFDQLYHQQLRDAGADEYIVSQFPKERMIEKLEKNKSESKMDEVIETLIKIEDLLYEYVPGRLAEKNGIKRAISILTSLVNRNNKEQYLRYFEMKEKNGYAGCALEHYMLWMRH
jgi:hypothetical protein